MSAALDPARLARTLERARERLLAERAPGGHWRGELSSSALAAATAALALELAARAGHAGERERALARRARAWLRAHPNADGGFGDTTDSPSNLATTALAWAALGLDETLRAGEPWRRLEARLLAFTGSLEPARLTEALLGAYGQDRTFSVPILVACALAGRLGPLDSALRRLPAIPFELATLPHGLFRFLGLPMVSYALPALIAIGQVEHAHAPSRNPLLAFVRDRARAATLATLARIQPESGGFLEATPLTSFVVLSLVGAGRGDHPVVERALAFLRDSERADGGFPIDTDLATWVTSLALEALAADGVVAARELAPARAWLAGVQQRGVHPYTNAAPGGFAWTDRTGGVPDADDTAGALLALAAGEHGPEQLLVAQHALEWLLGLQNRDGGIPTFCRGWSGLAFDTSCADLSAHALRAAAAWEAELPAALRARLARALPRLVAYLVRAQRPDGAWVPLWFGSQHTRALENPLHGTARVLAARSELVRHGAGEAVARAERWLLAQQAADGGFGAERGVAPSIEETALALTALCAALEGGNEAAREPAGRAAAWLVAATDEGRHFPAVPIGLYFAKLWYSERLYPLLFSLGALGRAARLLSAPGTPALR